MVARKNSLRKNFSLARIDNIPIHVFFMLFDTPLLSISPYHNIPLILNIKGLLDINILERSINDVIQRHEALRTRIITENDKPYQQVDQKVDFRLSLLDLPADGNTAGSRYHEAISRALAEANRPFLLHRDHGN